eukprot:scaffold170200_cov30-Tisochrysis_lutea.AAC.1
MATGAPSQSQVAVFKSEISLALAPLTRKLDYPRKSARSKAAPNQNARECRVLLQLVLRALPLAAAGLAPHFPLPPLSLPPAPYGDPTP